MFSRMLSLLLLAALPCAILAASDDTQALPDPTRPVLYDFNAAAASGGLLGSFFATAPTYTLGSVLIREQTRIAVINGKRVQVGDSVDGARVRRIEPDGVVLDQNGEQITLARYARPIKTLVKHDGQ